jgi:hypothetical protein
MFKITSILINQFLRNRVLSNSPLLSYQMVYDIQQLVYVLLRLGEADKAIYHLKQSSNESASADVSRAQSVKSRIAKSNDARRLKNWFTVLQEAQAAASDGADCAPQVSALVRHDMCHTAA